MNLKPGQVFAHDFEVIKKLGEGGFGAVYLTKQRYTNRLRALKIIRLDRLPQNEEDRKRIRKKLLERFAIEVKVGANIDSAHIAEVIAAGYDESSQCPWLVMEFLEGQDLFEYLRPSRYFLPEDALEILRQVCDALGAAHVHGIVHRDLKPENVFLARRPENLLHAMSTQRRAMPFTVKLLDFGIAKMVAEISSEKGETEEETVTIGIGTPYWMAPEQVNGRHRITPATDVWALGLLAFRMITGYMFWHPAATMGEILLAMESERHPLASERAAALGCRQTIPEGFDAWFAMCVANDPQDRYLSAVIAFRELEPVFAAFRAPPQPPEVSSVDPLAPTLLSPRMPEYGPVAMETEPFLLRNMVLPEPTATQPFLLRPTMFSAAEQDVALTLSPDDLEEDLGDEAGDRAQRTGSPELVQEYEPAISAEVIRHFASRLSALEHEELWVAALDENNAMQWAQRVQGSAHGSGAAPPKDILRVAIANGALFIIVVHNHPSGDPTPSGEDVAMTRALDEAAQVVGVPLVDHVIIGREQYVSMLEMGVVTFRVS